MSVQEINQTETPGFEGRRGRLEVKRSGYLTLAALQGLMQGAELLGVPPLADVIGLRLVSYSHGETIVVLDWAL